MSFGVNSVFPASVLSANNARIDDPGVGEFEGGGVSVKDSQQRKKTPPGPYNPDRQTGTTLGGARGIDGVGYMMRPHCYECSRRRLRPRLKVHPEVM